MSDVKEGPHKSNELPISKSEPTLEAITHSSFDALTGKEIGSFLIGSRLKVSGFSVVYHVTPKGTNQKMVMKIPRHTDTKEEIFVSFQSKKEAEETPSYLKQEADILMEIGDILNVMNIVTQDVAQIDGLWVQYMVSHYAGEPFYEVDLSDKDDPKVFSEFALDEELSVFIQIAKALSEANKRRHFHGDLKPANALVSRTSHKTPFTKLIDWNSKNRIEQEEKKLHETLGTRCPTETRITMATPRYFSPEQQEGRDVDMQTDVYSLGIMITECLTGGKKPGANVMKQVMKQAGKLAVFYKDKDDAINRMRSWLGEMGCLLERMLESTPFDRPLALEVYGELNALYGKLRNPEKVKVMSPDAVQACERYFNEMIKTKLETTLTDPDKKNVGVSIKDGWFRKRKVVDTAGIGFVNFGVLDVTLWKDEESNNFVVDHFLPKDTEYAQMIRTIFANDPAYKDQRGKTFATEYIELLSIHVNNAIMLHSASLGDKGWKPHQYILSAINYLEVLEMEGIIDDVTRIHGCKRLNDLVSALLMKRRDGDAKKHDIAALSSEAEYASVRKKLRAVYTEDFKLTQSDRLRKI